MGDLEGFTICTCESLSIIAISLYHCIYWLYFSKSFAFNFSSSDGNENMCTGTRSDTQSYIRYTHTRHTHTHTLPASSVRPWRQRKMESEEEVGYLSKLSVNLSPWKCQGCTSPSCHSQPVMSWHLRKGQLVSLSDYSPVIGYMEQRRDLMVSRTVQKIQGIPECPITQMLSNARNIECRSARDSFHFRFSSLLSKALERDWKVECA